MLLRGFLKNDCGEFSQFALFNEDNVHIYIYLRVII
jgi:hypothetical protein